MHRIGAELRDDANTVSDATMKRVRSILPDRQVVELAGAIAGYNMVSRFEVAIGIEVERFP